MHMDDLFSAMAQKPLAEIIRSYDLHTLHRVITEKRKDGLIIIFPSFCAFFFFSASNVFFTSREMHSSSMSTTINQHLQQ